jgi:hypothetical protein
VDIRNRGAALDTGRRVAGDERSGGGGDSGSGTQSWFRFSCSVCICSSKSIGDEESLRRFELGSSIV